MVSPTQCMHPECMAASSGDNGPGCLKLQTQNQSHNQNQTPAKTQAPVQLKVQIQVKSPSPTAQRTPTSGRHIKLRCDKCNDYPDGFRSEHELRRHTNRVHRETRKVWRTKDTSVDKSFLANCKACQSRKKYNECYNAASHLRRMHFHPRKRGEGKGEKRGGAGSLRSEDPPMEYLKQNWLEEVEEIAAEGSEEPRDDDDGNDDDKMDLETESETSPAQ